MSRRCPATYSLITVVAIAAVATTHAMLRAAIDKLRQTLTWVSGARPPPLTAATPSQADVFSSRRRSSNFLFILKAAMRLWARSLCCTKTVPRLAFVSVSFPTRRRQPRPPQPLGHVLLHPLVTRMILSRLSRQSALRHQLRKMLPTALALVPRRRASAVTVACSTLILACSLPPQRQHYPRPSF